MAINNAWFLTRHVSTLTHNPRFLLTIHGCPPRQFVYHSENTLASIEYTPVHFEMFADGTIDRKFRVNELQTNRALGPETISIQRYSHQQT